MKKNKFLALESLRGVAAISVAIFHFSIGSHLNTEFTKNAWLMVDFFFVLSRIDNFQKGKEEIVWDFK